MKLILLSQDKVAIVDNRDFEWLNQWCWHAHRASKSGSFYAQRSRRRDDPDGPSLVRMHRAILGMITEDVDHRDGNGLNNQRDNLRPASHSQNIANQKKHFDSSSTFKGVSWDSKREKWVARCGKHTAYRFLGRFDNEIDAAKAYDNEAVTIFREFARLNFPTPV